MTLLLSVPQDYKPGMFAYHDFMVFIVLANPSIGYFTGLHRHGGTTPSPLPGHRPVPWAYRVTVVCYPNSPTMRGESRNPLVPFRGFDIVKKNPTGDNNREDVLKIPPEIRFRQRYLSHLPQQMCLRWKLTVNAGQTASRQTLLVMDPLFRDPRLYSPPIHARLVC